MRHTFFALFVVAIASGCASARRSADSAVSDRLVGVWADFPEQCATNPESIEFTPDGEFMIVTRAKLGWATKTDSRKVFRYRILSRHATYLRVALENESRLDEQGRPVIWHIISVDKTTYCWGRDGRPDLDQNCPALFSRVRCEL